MGHQFRSTERQAEGKDAPLSDPVIEHLGLGLGVPPLFDKGARPCRATADDLAQEGLCGGHRQAPQDDGAALKDEDLANLAAGARPGCGAGLGGVKEGGRGGGPAREEDGLAEDVYGAVEEPEGLERLEEFGRVVRLGGREGDDSAIWRRSRAVVRGGCAHADGEERRGRRSGRCRFPAGRLFRLVLLRAL